MLDLEPATTALADLVRGVRDEQLADATPCSETSLGAMLDHLEGLCLGFIAAARKDLETGSQAPSADASHLRSDWRTEIPEQLLTPAQAWRRKYRGRRT